MKPAMMFQDHMVLQQRQEIPVWGEAVPGEVVRVSLGDCVSESEADAEGRFTVILPPMRAESGLIMTITCGKEQVKLEDVAVGEVWLAGGQSNMEFHMRYDKDLKEAIKACQNPDIRFFDYPEVSYVGQLESHDYHRFGFWRTANPGDLEYFSAVGYYFAAELYESLQVPIGILGCNWGGTRAVCWMDEATAQKVAGPWMDDYQKMLDQIPDLEAHRQEFISNPMNDTSNPFGNVISDRLLYGMSPEETAKFFIEAFGDVMGSEDRPPMNLIGPLHPWRPCGLYHTMLENVAPYAVRGVIWYQGESDSEHPDIYDRVLTGMIENWRRLWDRAETDKGDGLPFIMTQLAPFGEWMGLPADEYAILRDMQQTVADTVPGVYCTTIGDVGNYHDIHPKEKKPVGVRMALMALHYIYGMPVACEPPRLKSCVKTDSADALDLELVFGEGLTKSGDQPAELKLTGMDGLWTEGRDYRVELSDNRIRIRPEGHSLDQLKEVNAGYSGYYEMNLYNEAGLPLKPFLAVL